MTIEEKAEALASDRRRLKTRLNEARGLLKSPFNLIFRGAKFDFEGRRLVSKCGSWQLKWQLRPYAELPEYPGNLNTSRGCCQVYGMGKGTE